MLNPDYPVQTARLELRPFQDDDAEELYAYHRREDVTRYLFWEPRDRDEAEKALQHKIAEYRIDDEGQVLCLAVVERSGQRLIGEVNLNWTSRQHRQGFIGFVFNPEFQGRGFATEAADAVLRLGFDNLGLHRIIATCDARNSASARVMQRLGMRLEAHHVHNRIFKGEWNEELVYALLEEEWKGACDA